MNYITDLDYTILNLIYNNLRTDLCDKIFPIVTQLGNYGAIWIAIALVFLMFKKTRKLSIVILLSLGLTSILGNNILKPLLTRSRPFENLSNINLLIKAPTDFSFPSEHTATAFASAVPIFLFSKKLGIPALILASLIAFSRLYLYVHFPTDVLAGIILGTLVSTIIYKLAFRKKAIIINSDYQSRN